MFCKKKHTSGLICSTQPFVSTDCPTQPQLAVTRLLGLSLLLEMCLRLLWLQELQLGSAALAHTGSTEWTNSILLHLEKDVSASETWEECAAGDYCSCSADKQTFQTHRLPNPSLATAALNTISYAETCNFMASCPPGCSWSPGPPKERRGFPNHTEPACGATGRIKEKHLGAQNNRCCSTCGSGTEDLPAAGASGLCSTLQCAQPLANKDPACSAAPSQA